MVTFQCFFCLEVFLKIFIWFIFSLNMWGCWSGQTGQTQNLLAYAYAGSNPVPHINFIKHYKLQITPAS